MEGNYEFMNMEEKWKGYWKERQVYKFDVDSKKPIYSVDTPPPTVSGEMHIGHACSYSQQDIFVRYKRMKGFNIFYPFGTDDNGLPTERLVEKKENIKSNEMSRGEFIKLCLNFLEKERPRFIQDWRDIGISCDWDIIYSTIDNHSRKISQWSFIDLYKKGRIYRKDAPSMWCPECKTGVAQVEVEDKEFDSEFNDIIFKTEEESLVISTTRPELLSACVAIFYNPEDNRYKKYFGKKARVPLFDFDVPIMEDSRANPEKGTGLVMCCTFGDQTDMEWQKAYNLPIKMAISPEGKMTDISGKYAGMVIKKARKEIIQDLKNKELLIKQKPLKHIVNVHERCGTEIEFIKSKQWFVRYLDLKDEMVKWGDEIKWHPEHMKHRYRNWVKGLQWDWLISNQRHFGVAFPVWYCANCQEIILADEDQLPVDPEKDYPKSKKCPSCGGDDIIPERDVLNTWFTSSMTPQIAIGLVDKKIQERLFPMSLRPQAHDIITFWLFNTVLKSKLHFDEIPWKETIISGFVTMKGEKMSKSKGNIIRPQEVMEKYGADVLRYWATSASVGEDLIYREQDIVRSKKVINKLWNVSKFISTHLKDYKPASKPELRTVDRWLLSKLSKLVKQSTEFMDKYEINKEKRDVENFLINTFADFYLEMIKYRIYKEENEPKDEGALYTLYVSLKTLLKLLAPHVPFITEEVYNSVFENKSIHLSDWPELSEEDEASETIGDKAVYFISEVRKEKAKNKISVGAEIKKVIIFSELDLVDTIDDIKQTVRAKDVEFIKEKESKVEVDI